MVSDGCFAANPGGQQCRGIRATDSNAVVPAPYTCKDKPALRERKRGSLVSQKGTDCCLAKICLCLCSDRGLDGGHHHFLTGQKQTAGSIR